MNHRILIVQDLIPSYRIPFFDGLARSGLDLTVAHSGTRVSSPVTFKQEIVPAKRMGSFLHQPGVVMLARNYDAVVVPLNPKRTASLALWKGRPHRTILWGHGPGRSDVLNGIRVAMCNGSAAVAVYDEHGGHQLADLGVNRDLIGVVPNTIHVGNAGFDRSATRDQFLFVGRLQKRKRVADLIRAFELSLDHIPTGVQLTIVGSGLEEERLRSIVASRRIEHRVRFVGATTDDEKLRREFARSIAYVSPGWVGLSVLHSFAYGVPVVTDMNGPHAPEFANIVDGVNGLYFDGSIAGLSSVLQSLTSDPSRSFELGSAAYERYSSYRRMDQMVLAMHRLIEQSSKKNRAEKLN